jgi:hypothetical protein
MRVDFRVTAAGLPACATLLSPGSHQQQQDSGVHDPCLWGGFGSASTDTGD